MENKKAGQPTKYKKEYVEQVYKLCLFNATDTEIADFFNIVESTLYLWKLKHKQFSESMRAGKIRADTDVAQSLYKRAMGSKCVQQRAIKVKEPIFNEEGKKIGDNERVVVVDLLVEEPPDTKAIEFWLRNRHPDTWNKDKQVSEAADTSDALKQFVNGVFGVKTDGN